jgi:hypothetical protein
MFLAGGGDPDEIEKVKQETSDNLADVLRWIEASTIKGADWSVNRRVK